MKIHLLGVAALVAAAVLTPMAAHADEAPPLGYWTADEPGPMYLDCGTATWYVDVTHYEAAELEPGVWADPTITYRTDIAGRATYGPGGDCPAWVEPVVTVVDDAPAEQIEDAPAPQPAPEPADDGIVWKIGLA